LSAGISPCFITLKFLRALVRQAASGGVEPKRFCWKILGLLGAETGGVIIYGLGRIAIEI